MHFSFGRWFKSGRIHLKIKQLRSEICSCFFNSDTDPNIPKELIINAQPFDYRFKLKAKVSAKFFDGNKLMAFFSISGFNLLDKVATVALAAAGYNLNVFRVNANALHLLLFYALSILDLYFINAFAIQKY